MPAELPRILAELPHMPAQLARRVEVVAQVPVESTMSAWPAAVLWDLDGTLVDTEPAWIAAETALAERFGRTWTSEQGLMLVGRALLDAGGIMREELGLPLTPEEIVEELVDGVEKAVTESVTWRPGARELLGAVRADGLPCALVTMSYHRLTVPIVASLPPDTFGAVVTGDEVTRGKPHPDAYLIAAAQLGVPASACLAIEDSPTGAASASAAGCTVLVVPSHVTVPARDGYRFAASLDGLTVPALLALQAPG